MCTQSLCEGQHDEQNGNSKHRKARITTKNSALAGTQIICNEISIKKYLEYLQILHLAASTSEDEVKVALELLMADKAKITYENVKNLLVFEASLSQYHIEKCMPDLKHYDKLIGGAL